MERTVVGSVGVGLTDRLMTHHMEMLGELYPEGDNSVLFFICLPRPCQRLSQK